MFVGMAPEWMIRLCSAATLRREKQKAAVEARGGYEIGDTILGLTSRMSLNLNTAKTPAGSQTNLSAALSRAVTPRGTFVMEMEMASQGAPHRYFWAWPTQELGPSYSHHRTVEIPPPKSRDLPLGSVSLLALMPTSSIATSGQKRGAQEGKVAAPPPTSPNGSVVHCSPQLEDLKQPTGEGSQGPGYTFWRRRLSSSSLTCLSFHPSTTSFCQEGQSVQDNTPRPKQAGTARKLGKFHNHTQNSLNTPRGREIFSMVRYHRVTRRHGSRSDTIKTQPSLGG